MRTSCRICKIHVSEVKDCKNYQESCFEFEKQNLSKRNDAVVQLVVEDPIDVDRILAEAGKGMIPAACEASASEKMKHQLTHIHLQPWCTSCAKGTAQGEPHKQSERITEDSELLTVQRDYLVLKDVPASDGPKVLSMYVKSFGYGTSTVVETKGATDTFAVTWRVKILNCLGLSDIILQCDPEPSLIQWTESVKSNRQERTAIRSSPRRSHPSNGAVANSHKQLQGQVRTMLAALQDRTHCIPTTDSALMKWTVGHAAWPFPRFRSNDAQSPFYRALGGPYRGNLLEFGESVEQGSGNAAPKLAGR